MGVPGRPGLPEAGLGGRTVRDELARNFKMEPNLSRQNGLAYLGLLWPGPSWPRLSRSYELLWAGPGWHVGHNIMAQLSPQLVDGWVGPSTVSG
ncbi:hypothetical protein TorRG33x02_305970 [Trema orientale]|uniref:Uncharacterized protein n=1 Tax=Trema orientale TaxID=63057 RepID=A0A2P5BWP7_TREOI|nr:hypothetical protein TorRG33x02_305970 [Trema orientale]